MKTIGLVGGMSWESSAEYYRIINQRVKERLGGLHSAQTLMYSVDFSTIETLQHAGEWDELTRIMIGAVRRLEGGGADFGIICTNTMHRMFDVVQESVSLPLIHIADPTAAAIRAAGLQRIGLLGTRFTMEGEFYRGRMQTLHGLDMIIPDGPDRDAVHNIIYYELVLGIITEESRQRYREIMARLVARGAQGIILGCTEIMLLVGQADSEVPVFDTTTLHAVAAADQSISS